LTCLNGYWVSQNVSISSEPAVEKIFTQNLLYTYRYFTNHCAIATKKALPNVYAFDNATLALKKKVLATHLQDRSPQSLAICESDHE